jgi:hypothetical protein
VPGGASQAVTGGGALFTGSAANPSSPGANTLITRIDLATGRVGPATTISGASGMVFGGGLLWVGRGAQPTSADMTVVALDPVTLAVRYAVALGQPPSFGTQQLAYAGGLVWVATEETLIAIDPATAHAVADVPSSVSAARRSRPPARTPGWPMQPAWPAATSRLSARRGS